MIGNSSTIKASATRRSRLFTVPRIVISVVVVSAVAVLVFVVAPAALTSTSLRPVEARGPSRVVVTSDGPVRGRAEQSHDEFLGIPFAAPPIGALRWRPPQAAARWVGLRDATSFGPNCAQTPGTFSQASTSEDCLYLNVYTPPSLHPSAAAPVMVWIPGGGFKGGAGRMYDPTPLVHHGVVVVTINYRVGAFGFLAHPALADDQGGAGDYGLMDQQAALRWVQHDIAAFGGDPHAVTVFGESSGGASVLAQLASPQAATLFQKAIVESGTYTIDTPTTESAETAGRAFATSVGCPDQTAACLRSVPVDTLLAKESSQYVPNIDPAVLPRSVRAAFDAGQINRVPLIDGTNHDEGRLFVASAVLAGHPVTHDTYTTAIASLLGLTPTRAQQVAAVYPIGNYPDAARGVAAAYTDAAFACPALSIDQAASRYVPTYTFEFADPDAPQVFLPPVGFPYGAAHASELQYLFALPGVAHPATLSPTQQRLSQFMQASWTSFAAHGRPTLTGASPWPAFTGSDQQTETLAPAGVHPPSAFATDHRCDFWDAPTP